jgi:hypothetical protein
VVVLVAIPRFRSSTVDIQSREWGAVVAGGTNLLSHSFMGIGTNPALLTEENSETIMADSQRLKGVRAFQ